MKERRREILLIACLSVIVAVSFLPVLQGKFTSWDDSITVTENPFLWRGFSAGLLPLLRHGYKELYVPVTYLVYWIQFQLCGANAFCFHLGNLLIHVANVALAYLIFARLLPGKLPAVIAALWWGVHPLNVEPVAWVTGLKDVLALFFMLMSLRLYMAWREVGATTGESRLRAPLWGASLFAFALACFSKPAAVAFPIVLVGYDMIMARRKWSAIWPVTPFLVVSVSVTIITMTVQKAVEYGVTVPDLVGRLRVAGDSTLFYLEKLLMPIQLSPVYERTVSGVLAANSSWFRALAAAAICAVALLFGRRWRFGIVIFIAGIAPVSGLSPFQYQAWVTVADRYAYFSAVGIALILGDIVSRVEAGVAARNARWKFPLFFCAGVWIALFCGMTWRQCGVWKDSGTLWGRVAVLRPDFAEAWNNLGIAKSEKGDYEEAIQYCTRAIELKSDYVEAYANRGVAKAAERRYREAIEDYNKAIELDPNHPTPYDNRGVAYVALGEFDRAIADCNRALDLNPDYARCYFNRGSAWFGKKDYEQAIADFTSAINRAYAYRDAYYNRAVAYYLSGGYDKSWEDLRQFRALGGVPPPDFVELVKRKSGQTE